jgi:hypothetical protein
MIGTDGKWEAPGRRRQRDRAADAERPLTDATDLWAELPGLEAGVSVRSA